MQDKPSGAGNEGAATTADQDDRDQASVLREILFIYPETITLPELIRELTVSSSEFHDRDRVERAARDLTAAGLLHRRDDGLVLPTRSAVRFCTLAEL